MSTFADRVKQTTTTTGTGTIDLDGSSDGFQGFVAAGLDGLEVEYAIVDGNAWEVGRGTVTDAATDTLSRDTLLDSSTGSKLNLSGSAEVFLTASASFFNRNDIKQGAAIASATALPVNVAGVSHSVTGTTTVTSLADPTNDTSNVKILTFAAALTLTNSASLILPGGANITTAAGDSSIFVYEGSSVWRCVSYVKADGTSLASSVGSGNSINDFRLTLTSGTPVTTADVSAAGTIYMTPYKGNNISVYTGSAWTTIESAELSVSVPSDANQVFDVFLDYNAGTPQLVTTNWTNDTTRATALTYQDGVYVQTGNVDWRYLGTARTKTASQVDDTVAFRHLWNYYNRADKPMLVEESTNSWTYTTATIRQANGSVANQLDFVVGVSEDEVSARALSVCSNSGTLSGVGSGIGLDSTTAFNGLSNNISIGVANSFFNMCSSYSGYVGAGRHFLSWNEYSSASGTTTWYGDTGGFLLQCGIEGNIKC